MRLLYKKYNGMKSSLAQKYINQYAIRLANEGKKLIDKAFASADFNKNRTQNLHDSYGSCVFYNRREVPNTRRYVGRKAVVGKKNPQGELILGRAEIDNYFDTYKTHTDGFELVTAAAIFYAEILEKGMGSLTRKYRVISGLDAGIERLAGKAGGKVIDLNP